MSYHDMYSQNDVFGKMPLRAESKTLSGILLSKEYITRKLADGIDPVELSIVKWNRVKDVYLWTRNEGWRYLYFGDIYFAIGSETCPLCIVALNDFENESVNQKHIKDKCSKCKLAKIECCPDLDSLFSNITYLLGYEPPAKRVFPN